jgi:phage repressor protein C with HTH and peptisase S24 domain
MADIVGSRLEWLLQDRHTSQSALARELGVSQPTIGRLISGETRETGKIIELARALGTTPEYLIGETEDDGPSARVVIAAPSDDDEEIVEIKELDLAFGMGGGSYLDLPVRPKGRKFARDWLRLYTSSPPSRIFLARGIGDSMSPTIQNDDVVIIDTAQDAVRIGDQIWAVAYGNFGLIKRLRPLPSGGIKIMSDNPLVESEIAYDGELHTIGKVVAVVRKMAG